MSKCLDPFRFLLISLAVWMNQQWPISTRPIKPRVVVTAATLVSVMNGWRAVGMRRVHGFGVLVWPENSIYLKQREIIPGVVDNEMTRCQSAWTRSASC